MQLNFQQGFLGYECLHCFHDRSKIHWWTVCLCGSQRFPGNFLQLVLPPPFPAKVTQFNQIKYSIHKFTRSSSILSMVLRFAISYKGFLKMKGFGRHDKLLLQPHQYNSSILYALITFNCLCHGEHSILQALR